MAVRFDKFTERARRVLTFAQEEAMRLNHTTIGPEHILLGLSREGDGIAAKVLVNNGVKLEDLRSGVAFLIGRGERATLDEIGLTSAAKEVVQLAVKQANSLGHHFIGTEHLLLGLLAFPEDNVASQLLKQFGVDFEKMRAEVVTQLDVFFKTPLTGLTDGQRSKIHQAVADSLAAFDQFEVDKENPARLEFETIAAELTQTLVKLIKREPGWIGFLHFAVDAVGETYRSDEIVVVGTAQDKWFDYISLHIWNQLFQEFTGLDSSEIEKAQEAVGRIKDVLSQVKK